MGENQARQTFEELTEAMVQAGTRAVVLYERLAGAIENNLTRKHLQNELDNFDLRNEVRRLRRLLDLARRPLVDHEPGELCQIALEPGDIEPTCWICKLRDASDPEVEHKEIDQEEGEVPHG
jgi:hypothetical protein